MVNKSNKQNAAVSRLWDLRTIGNKMQKSRLAAVSSGVWDEARGGGEHVIADMPSFFALSARRPAFCVCQKRC